MIIIYNGVSEKNIPTNQIKWNIGFRNKKLSGILQFLKKIISIKKVIINGIYNNIEYINIYMQARIKKSSLIEIIISNSKINPANDKQCDHR